MQVGGADTVVEVSGQAPLIDTTTKTTQTNITEDVVKNVSARALVPVGHSVCSFGA